MFLDKLKKIFGTKNIDTSKKDVLKPLIGIGYWHNRVNPHFPDPGHFVDPTWDPAEKHAVLNYLKTGFQMPYIHMGHSWCRFRCGDERLGTTEFTDGTYLWPEGLPHYIEKHNVRLPADVVQDMLSNKNPTRALGNREVGWTWWVQQQGWNATNHTFNDLEDAGILTIQQRKSVLRLKQGDYLRKYLMVGLGAKEKNIFIDRVLQGEKASLKGCFKYVDGFIEKLPPIGLEGNFQRTEMSDDIRHSRYINL